jgi:hypothetical protein
MRHEDTDTRHFCATETLNKETQTNNRRWLSAASPGFRFQSGLSSSLLFLTCSSFGQHGVSVQVVSWFMTWRANDFRTRGQLELAGGGRGVNKSNKDVRIGMQRDRPNIIVEIRAKKRKGEEREWLVSRSNIGVDLQRDSLPVRTDRAP